MLHFFGGRGGGMRRTRRGDAAHLAGAMLALFCGEAAKIMYILPVGAASGREVAAGSGERPREREREREPPPKRRHFCRFTKQVKQPTHQEDEGSRHGNR